MWEPNSTARPVSSKVVRCMVSTGAPVSSPSRSPSSALAARAPTDWRALWRVICGPAHQPVQAGGLHALVVEFQQLGGRKLQRYAIGSPCARRSRSTRWTSLPSVTPRAAATSVDAGSTVLTTTWVAGHWPSRLQVVVEAAEFQGALDLAVHDLGADASAPHEEPLVDEGLDGLADRGAGQPEPRGELDLVAEQASRGQDSVFDGGLELLRQLEVQRDRTGAVDAELERHGRIHNWFGHGSSVAPGDVDGKL